MAQATSLSLRSRFITSWSALKITSTSWFVQFWSKSSKCKVCGASTAMVISFQEKILSRDLGCHNIRSAAFWEGLSTRCCGYEKSSMPNAFWYSGSNDYRDSQKNLNTITSLTSSKFKLRYHHFNPARMFSLDFFR